MTVHQIPHDHRSGQAVVINQWLHAIIGCGNAAVVDHCTLIHPGNDDLRGRVAIVHAGLPEPWRERGGIALGQYPHLLRSAAYPQRVALAGAADGYAAADAFGAYIRGGLAAVRAEPDPAELDRDVDHIPAQAWVGLIDRKDHFTSRSASVPADDATTPRIPPARATCASSTCTASTCAPAPARPGSSRPTASPATSTASTAASPT